MKKSTVVILFFVCIAVILASGCTTTAPAPVNTTERIVYVTVIVTPTSEPLAAIPVKTLAPTPAQTPRSSVTTDPSKYVQTSSARTDNDSGTPDEFPPIIGSNRATAVYSSETAFIECINNQESKNIQLCLLGKIK